MSKLVALGCDPSMRNFGLVKVQIDLDTMSIDQILEMKLIETTSGDTKRVRKNSDDLDRCRALSAGLHQALSGCQISFAEMPVGSQSARAMASYGMCMGILSQIQIPLIQLTPTEVKLAATGDKNATKREMITWASSQFPQAGWFKGRSGLGDKNEHLADALGAIKAGLKHEDFLGYMTIMKAMRA